MKFDENTLKAQVDPSRVPYISKEAHFGYKRCSVRVSQIAPEASVTKNPITLSEPRPSPKK